MDREYAPPVTGRPITNIIAVPLVDQLGRHWWIHARCLNGQWGHPATSPPQCPYCWKKEGGWFKALIEINPDGTSKEYPHARS